MQNLCELMENNQGQLTPGHPKKYGIVRKALRSPLAC